MTKEEYRKHLGEVVMAVFAAELSAIDVEPELREMLRRREISGKEYCERIADEMLGRMSEGDLEKVLKCGGC